MISRIKTLALTLFSAGALLMPAMVPATVYADDLSQNLCSGAELNINSTSCNVNDPAAESKINNIIRLVINLFSIIVGIIAVVMIIYGGVRYITSGGESSNTAAAKNTILFAIIGLIIVALAQILVRFVLSKIGSTG